MELGRFYLEIAMEEAEIAFKNKTYPVGAVIIDPDGKIISRGHNHVYHQGIFTSHAEIEAIRDAGDMLMRKQNSCILYTTLEPCLMCCGAIIHARIARVIWIKDDNTHGALRCLHKNARPLSNFYLNKFDTLEISRADEYDLVRRMDKWMDEVVLSEWEQDCRQESRV